MKNISNYHFLTAKPMLIIINIGENQIDKAVDIENELRSSYSHNLFDVIALSGKIEMELSQLEEAEAREFRDSMGLKLSAIQRVISISYDLLGLLSFFTTASSELKAWTISGGTTALKAAGKIHTDMERGFIRAEVISYDDLLKSGNIHEAKKHGLLRLEGKNYLIQDGDIITFLFNI
jgi:ribosome-binding ATPase YchF (GTP1/OBG family)